MTRSTLLLLLTILPCLPATAAAKPNVLLIVCDDLNDYIAPLAGHPQVKTPNIDRLANSGVSFQQAHCTIPICAPSRSSFLCGHYPHTTRNYGFDKWIENPVLKNSRTLMDHFRANGYHTLGTGKLMHNEVKSEWSEFGNDVDYSPFASDGEENVAHPDIPSPLRDDFGAIDGSFGPLVNVKGRKFPDGKPCGWAHGNWRKIRPMRVDSQDDRDQTADELNRDWAVEKLKTFAKNPDSKPFFMGVGFIRPHTPLIVPQRYFDMFPLDSLELPVIKDGDAEDTFLSTVSGGEEADRDRGVAIYRSLVASYPSREEAIKRFLQAYLACVASVDDLLGDILEVIDNSPLKDNTIIIFTSDHGWGMGEKDYLYKNSLWEESTRVPLIVRAPGIAKPGGKAAHPVSLVDLYPTLIDLCKLTGNTVKNESGRPLDGHSIAPFLRDPSTDTWDGPDAVLTSIFRWQQSYIPSEQSYSLRSKDWRYIRYASGKEELYHNAKDPYEWTNLVDDPEQAARLKSFRKQLDNRMPDPDDYPAPAPAKNADSAWKDKYFGWHPDADTDKDGKLSWPEYKTHKTALDKKKADKAKKKNAP